METTRSPLLMQPAPGLWLVDVRLVAREMGVPPRYLNALLQELETASRSKSDPSLHLKVRTFPDGRRITSLTHLLWAFHQWICPAMPWMEFVRATPLLISAESHAIEEGIRRLGARMRSRGEGNDEGNRNRATTVAGRARKTNRPGGRRPKRIAPTPDIRY